MNVNAVRDPTPPRLQQAAGGERLRRTRPKPFAGLIDAVLVEDPADFVFEGAIRRVHAEAIWTWVSRDLVSGSSALEEPGEVEPLVPQMLRIMRGALDGAATDADARLAALLGGTETAAALPVVANALRFKTLIDKAASFGRSSNSIADDGALGAAVRAMPLNEKNVAGLLMQAAIRPMANPARLVSALVKIAGSSDESAVVRMGFGPVLDAMLAHAQNQLHLIMPHGAFADIDLTCRGLDRLHRLLRPFISYLELGRGGPRALALAEIIKAASARVEPRLRDVTTDVIQAMRRPREGVDRLDPDRLLAALNGIYLLAAVRDCRDSLALNALFEQTWAQTGQALELHLTRTLDARRADPSDAVAAARLDTGIKMAELRFGADYADILRRARDAAERRVSGAG